METSQHQAAVAAQGGGAPASTTAVNADAAAADAALGCVLGALIGDAAGGPLEFIGRAPTEAEVVEHKTIMAGHSDLLSCTVLALLRRLSAAADPDPLRNHHLPQPGRAHAAVDAGWRGVAAGSRSGTHTLHTRYVSVASNPPDACLPIPFNPPAPQPRTNADTAK